MKPIIIDLDALLDLLIPYEGKVDEIRILQGKVTLKKSDGTVDVVSVKQLRKPKELEKPPQNVGEDFRQKKPWPTKRNLEKGKR